MKNNKETVKDIILQIWNDGAEGITYKESDINSFRRRLRRVYLDSFKEPYNPVKDLQDIYQMAMSRYIETLSHKDTETFLKMISDLEKEIKENNCEN